MERKTAGLHDGVNVFYDDEFVYDKLPQISTHGVIDSPPAAHKWKINKLTS